MLSLGSKCEEIYIVWDIFIQIKQERKANFVRVQIVFLWYNERCKVH